MPALAGAVAGARRRTIAYGPRVTPGLAGAVDTPSWSGMPPTLVRLDGTETNLTVAANTLVLPTIGETLTLQGQTSFGAGSAVYGATLDPNGASWCALIDADDVSIRQCDFVGSPGVEVLRPRRSGLEVVANRFNTDPNNHDIKVDGRTIHSGGGTISDNLFEGSPGEDHIQLEEQTSTTVEYNQFDGNATEDCIDVKSGDDVTVRGHDFVGGVMGSEALLFQNDFGLTGGVCRSEHNRFGSGCFHSFGAHPDENVDVQGGCYDSVFTSGATLRLRASTDLEIARLGWDAATFVLGTSTSGDFPTDAEIHHCDFTDLTITVANASSTTDTHDNTYAGTTTGTFPGPQGGND